MTNSHEVLATVLHRVAPDVDLADIDPDELLQDAADLDSMDFLNMMTALHELTGIDVPEHDYPQLATITFAERYIDQHTTDDGTSAPGSSAAADLRGTRRPHP